jgi:glycosyltransferase involved in cell wall biosynthesis
VTRVLLTFDWFLKYTAEQAVGLRANGAEVLVVCRDHLGEFGGDRAEWATLIEMMRSAGVEVHVIEGRVSSLRALRTAAAARRRIGSWKPDIVHVHENLDPWLLLVSRGVPLVETIHDVQPHPGHPEHDIVRRNIGRAWRRLAKAYIVHGEKLRVDLRSRAGGRPIAVIPIGVKAAPAPDPIPEQQTILFLGRLEPYKGLHVLVEAMQEVWRARPDVVLVVAGRGPSAAEVPEHPKIRRLLRYVSEEEVDRLLAQATLVAAPYIEASQSAVVSLAVARGIPTVVTDQGSLAELAPDPSLVVPAGDVSALAESLLAHLDHGPELRARVYEMACGLSWTVVGKMSIAFYDELREG